jgi:TPR repeat protein
MPVEVLMTKGILTLDFQSIQFALDTGQKIEFDSLQRLVKITGGGIGELRQKRKKRKQPVSVAIIRQHFAASILWQKKGDAAAQFSLGQMQANDRDVEKDYAEAIK